MCVKFVKYTLELASRAHTLRRQWCSFGYGMNPWCLLNIVINSTYPFFQHMPQAYFIYTCEQYGGTELEEEGKFPGTLLVEEEKYWQRQQQY